MNGYDLSRNFWNWAFENPDLMNPSLASIYFFAIEHCNRLGGKEKFGFPSQMTMDAVGISKHQTYIKYFNQLVDLGFIKLIQKSKNQYSANIISIPSAIPKKGKALDKAFIKHGAKQTSELGQSKHESDGSIVKQVNKEQINNDVDEGDIISKIKHLNDLFIKEIKDKKHSLAIEQIYMRLRIKEGTLKKVLDDFMGQLIIDKKLHKNTQELLRHFSNYCNTQDRVGKLDEYKTHKRAGAL